MFWTWFGKGTVEDKQILIIAHNAMHGPISFFYMLSAKLLSDFKPSWYSYHFYDNLLDPLSFYILTILSEFGYRVNTTNLQIPVNPG